MKLAGTRNLQVETTYHHYARKPGCWEEGTRGPLTPPSQWPREIRKINPPEGRWGETARGDRASRLRMLTVEEAECAESWGSVMDTGVVGRAEGSATRLGPGSV